MRKRRDITLTHLIRLGAHLVPSKMSSLVGAGRNQIAKRLDGVKKVKRKNPWNFRSERAHHRDHLLGERSLGLVGRQRIYDLDQTIVQLRNALRLVQEIRRRGGTVLFVLPQTEEAITKELKRLGQCYICDGWIGGLLTNFKKSFLRTTKRNVEFHLERIPDAIVIINNNPSVNRLGIQEGYQLSIPVVAFVPSNSKVPYPVASRNDTPVLSSFYRALFVQAIVQTKVDKERSKSGGYGLHDKMERGGAKNPWYFFKKISGDKKKNNYAFDSQRFRMKEERQQYHQYMDHGDRVKNEPWQNKNEPWQNQWQNKNEPWQNKPGYNRANQWQNRGKDKPGYNRVNQWQNKNEPWHNKNKQGYNKNEPWLF